MVLSHRKAGQDAALIKLAPEFPKYYVRMIGRHRLTASVLVFASFVYLDASIALHLVVIAIISL